MSDNALVVFKSVKKGASFEDFQVALVASIAGVRVSFRPASLAEAPRYRKGYPSMQTASGTTLGNTRAICQHITHVPSSRGTQARPNPLSFVNGVAEEWQSVDHTWDFVFGTLNRLVSAVLAGKSEAKDLPWRNIERTVQAVSGSSHAGAVLLFGCLAPLLASAASGKDDSAPAGPAAVVQWVEAFGAQHQEDVAAALKLLKAKTLGKLLHVAGGSVFESRAAERKTTLLGAKGTAKGLAKAKAKGKSKGKGSASTAEDVLRPADKAWNPDVPPGHTAYSWDWQVTDAVTRKAENPPLAPVKGRRNVLITSALPYVNNVPHLGNIIGCVLSADVYARFCRLRGYNTLYICGTDEYGTATETKAAEENVSPKEICDKYHTIHKRIYEWFNISFDHFGRTTTSEQTEITQDIFKRNQANGNIFPKVQEQLWCGTCDRFLADRYVEGTCPNCGYEDARGDQCDKCGRLVDKLVNPRCKKCSNTPEEKESQHLFINLPKIKDDLEAYVDSEKKSWSDNARTNTEAIIAKLKARPITRDLKWGTPVPTTGIEEFDVKEKVFYVWFDAPIGYISITATYTKEWAKWWKNPDDVELVQFMGKDNIVFHTVMFPSTLIGAKDNYTLLKNISTTEYLNYEDDKFSKSRGVGVFGDDAMNTGIPSEVWRYYLLINRPEAADSVFSWVDFAAKNNSELLSNLGNFVNRALKFSVANFDGVVPAFSLADTDECKYPELASVLQAIVELQADVTAMLRVYVEHLEACHIKDGLKQVMAISTRGNKFFQDVKPWTILKKKEQDEAKRRDAKIACGIAMGWSVNLVHLLATTAQPYMPALTDKICNQLGCSSARLRLPKGEPSQITWQPGLRAGHPLGKPAVLFHAIEEETVLAFKAKFAGNQASRQEQNA